MNEQLPLHFPGRMPRAARMAGDLHRLSLFLTGRPWTTAGEIEAALGWSDRRVRTLAHASRGEIISGQAGYKLTREATMEEIRHARTWLRSQAREMIARSIQIDRVFHQGGRPA